MIKRELRVVSKFDPRIEILNPLIVKLRGRYKEAACDIGAYEQQPP